MRHWQIGLASVEITPNVGATLSGFVARSALAVGVHDPLFAKCVAVGDGANRAALLVLDLIGVDRELVSEVRQRVSALPAEHVAVLATHTHGGPSVLRRSFLGEVDKRYLASVVARGAEAVNKAVERMQAGVVRFGVGVESTIAKNRRDPNGPTDPEVPVVRFEDVTGKVLGLLVSYACHPVTLGADNLLVTRDYPGEVVASLEPFYPGAEILFATGCSGQLNTGHSAEDSVTGRGAERRTFAEARRIGRILAGTALRTSERLASPFREPNTPPPLLKVVTRTVGLPLQPLKNDELQKQKEAWRAELECLRARGDAPAEAARLESLLRWSEMIAESTHRALKEELMVVALGEVMLVIFPGEMFVEFGLELKARFPETLLMTLAYGNGAPGYVPHRTAYAQGGYEVEDAYRFYGLPAVFAPQAGEVLLETAIAMLREVGA